MTGDNLPRSQYKYGGKYLHELSHAELIETVDGIWNAKNEELSKAKGERDGLKELLKSPLPIHSLWRSFAENAMLFIGIALIAYSFGAQHAH
jgi:hypothetical protein